MTSIVTKNSSGTVLQSRTYTFDLASQVTQVVEGGVTTDYDYDDIGQFVEESKSTGYVGAYTYDANGNRLTRTVNSVTESYSYDTADKLTAITGGSDARTFTYDAAGRTTGIVRGSGTTAFSYDYESRVTSITKPGMTTNSFSYNGLDTRVGLVDSGGSKTFKRAGVGVTAPVLSDGTATFTPSGEKRGSVKMTFHSALKNDDIQTSSSQVVSAAKQFDAFGNELGSSGSWTSQFGYAGKFGYQSDPDSGLKLLGHRYYDSDTGRFLTRDPVKDGRNWYTYCKSNPIVVADPTGLVQREFSAEDFANEARNWATDEDKQDAYKRWFDDPNWDKGGNRSTDCAHFVLFLIRRYLDPNAPLSGTTALTNYLANSDLWEEIPYDPRTLEEGDIVVSEAGNGRNYGHAMIYLGNGQFAQASLGFPGSVTNPGSYPSVVSNIETKKQGKGKGYRVFRLKKKKK